MKVALISPYSIRKVTGVGTSILDLCRDFERKQIGYMLIVPAVKDSLELNEIYKAGKNYFEIPSADFPFTYNLNIINRSLRLLLKKRSDVDVIHVFTIKSTTAAAAILARILNKPVVTTIYVIQPPPEGLLRRAINSVSMEIIFKLTDNFAYETYVARKQCGFLPGLIIPEGIDVNHFRRNTGLRKQTRATLGISPKSFVLLYSGRLVENKGINELLNAVETLPGKIQKRLKLILIGNFESEKIKRRIEGLKDQSWFLHQLPVARDEIKNYYLASDAFVLPSYIEGISSSLIEAMSCELPPIVSNVGGNVEVVEHDINGLVVEPRDVENLRKSIEKLIKNKKMRSRIGKNARITVVNNFSLNKKSDLYIKLYNRSMKVTASQ
ncbi:MAG: glycosyltransferase family 4 protein [Thermoplasmata archaeon]|nr:MAG: glycosyltransferase family 4 protein [Thermoplasmata archaeon]